MSHYIESWCSKHGEYSIDVDNLSGCPECFTLSEAFAYLYSHEINCCIKSFWDAGFDVRIGDKMNGYIASQNFTAEKLWEAGNWLVSEAKRFYPKAEWKKKQ